MKPRLLDLYCKAGGAARGYQLAGFHVTGVDIEPQPRYAGDAFLQADALTVLSDPAFLAGFDAIHASPPCHDHSALKSRSGEDGSGWLLPATRDALRTLRQPWVIENVPGAAVRRDLTLCGGMFGLRTYRHRWFELTPAIQLIGQPAHPPHRIRTSTKKRRICWDAGMHISVTGDVGVYVGSQAMGIDWMTGDELSQAIPPAYAWFIGEQLLTHLAERGCRMTACSGCRCTDTCAGCGRYGCYQPACGCYQPLEDAVTRPPVVPVPRPPVVAVKEGPVAPWLARALHGGWLT